MGCCGCCCCCGSKEKTEQRDKAYRQHDQDVVTKQPGRTASSGYLELSNSDQHCNNDDAFSGAAVGTGQTGPDSSSKKIKAPDPPAQNLNQTPGPTAQGRNSDEAVQDRQRWDGERQRLEEKYQTDTKELHRQLVAMKEEKEKLEERNNTYETELKKTKTDLERVENEKKDMENAKQQLQAVLDSRSSKEKKKKELQKQNEDMKRSKEEVERKLREREASFNDLMHSHRQNEHMIQAKEVQMAKLREEKKNLEMEKDELLVRLSALAGRKLTDNNPNIADLSDVNRPTKLAEKFSELYDNAWTDAFSEVQDLENFKDEEKTVTLLLDLLTLAYNKAMKAAEDQLISLKTTLEIFSGSDDTLVNDVLKQLKDSRKKITVPNKALEQVYRHALEQQEPEMLLKVKTLERYMKECLELCWLMAIQDPPLYFHTDGCRKGDTFDKNSFKEYTQGGYLVDFAVWPALYLQKGGSLLAKGVVQCKKMLDKSVLKTLPNKPASESQSCLTDAVPKPDNKGGVKTTMHQSLTVSRNGEETNAIINETAPVEENFEHNANKDRRNKEDSGEPPCSKASKPGFVNLTNNEENGQTQTEKDKLTPEMKEPGVVEVKKFSNSATSRSRTEHEKGNATSTVLVTITNEMKSESDSEKSMSNPFETRDDSAEPDVTATSRPEECKNKQNTVTVIEEMPRTDTKNEDLHSDDLRENVAYRSEGQLSKPDLNLSRKNESDTVTPTGSFAARKAVFESKTQPAVLNYDNISKHMETDTVQRNSTPGMQVNEPKQRQDIKKNSSGKVDGKHITSLVVESSATTTENLATTSEAKGGTEQHVSSSKKMFLGPKEIKDSGSEQANLKQTIEHDGEEKAKTSQGTIIANRKANKGQKLSIQTMPAGKW